MNDFTKEDLNKIVEALGWWFQESPSSITDEFSPVYNKIQSMIDNYCEHAWAFYINPDERIVKCQKCLKEIY